MRVLDGVWHSLTQTRPPFQGIYGPQNSQRNHAITFISKCFEDGLSAVQAHLEAMSCCEPYDSKGSDLIV